jgi:hypothetical protein
METEKHVRVPRAAKVSLADVNNTQDYWSEIYTTALQAVWETNELLKCADSAYAKRVATAARNLADAALDEWENRWGI